MYVVIQKVTCSGCRDFTRKVTKNDVREAGVAKKVILFTTVNWQYGHFFYTSDFPLLVPNGALMT